MTLEPEEEYEFIVVIKSPMLNKQTLFAANVEVHCDALSMVHKVFCFGCMEQLKVVCPKEMYNTQHQSKMIKVVMRRKQQTQSIKLLLENKSDMEVMANFQSIEMQEDLQFFLPKDKLHIDAKSKGLIEIKALHNLNKSGNKGGKNEPEVIHKLIIAKVKD